MNQVTRRPRKVNPKAVVILLGALAILGVSGFFLHKFQVKRNASALLEEAMRMEAEGKPGKAREAYMFYVRLVPTNAEALEKYGQLLLKEKKSVKDTLNGYLILERSLRLDGSRMGLHRQLAELALAFRRYDDFDVHLKALEDATPLEPALPLLRAHYRVVRSAPGDLDQAENEYKAAIKAGPKQVEAYEQYARLLRVRRKPAEQADALIAKMIEVNPRSAAARMAAARYYLEVDQPERAEENVHIALDELGANDVVAFSLGAECARAVKKPEVARARLERGLKEHPQELHMTQALAQVVARGGDVEKAKALLGSAFADLPNDPNQLISLGNSAADLSDTLRLKDVLRQLEKLGFASDPWSQLLQARVHELEEKWHAARIALEQLATRLPSGSALARMVNLHLAECYRRLHNPAQCIAACQRLLKDENPASSVALRLQQLLAASLQEVGDIEGAIAAYRGLVRRQPELKPDLVRLLLRRALTQPAGSRDWTEVDRVVADLSKGTTKGADVDLLRGTVLLAQGKPAKAAELAEAIRRRDPKQVEAWRLLFDARQQEGRAKDVPGLIDEAERAVGPRADWPLARARYALTNDRAHAASRLATLETVALPAAEQPRLWFGLGQFYALLGDAASTERVWRQYVAKDPTNLTVWQLLVEAQLSTGKEADLRTTAQQLTQYDQDGALAAFAGAAAEYLLARGSSASKETKETAIAKAYNQLAQAAAARPSWTRVPVLQGQLEELEGHKDRAIEHYRAAIDLGERGPDTLRRVLNLYFDLHRYVEANALLAKLPQQALATPDMARLGAYFALAGSSENPTEAAEAHKHAFELAKKGVSMDSKDYRDFVWLGHAASLAGQPAEAEIALRRAVELAPKNPEPRAALLFLLARSKPAAIEKELADAREALPKEELPFALGPCYESMGQLPQAEAQYLAAVALRPEDARLAAQLARFYVHHNLTAKAEPLLRKLVEGKLKDAESQLPWARRHLALAVAAHGGVSAYQKAELLLDENARGGDAAIEDKQARALILAAQPSHRREAIALLESLAAGGAGLSAELGVTLARLYEADGNWREAQSRMLAVLTANPKNATAIALYIQSLLRQNEKLQAREWVDRLAALEPGTFGLVELQVQVLFAEKRLDEAARLLKGAIDRKGAQLDRAAVLLEQIGRPAEAEAVFRTVAQQSSRPEGQLLLAGFLARQKRLNEALGVLEAAWKTCKPDFVAQASVAAIRAAGNPADEAAQRVESWINTAIAKHPNVAALPVCLAELAEVRGNLPEAIRLYREVVLRDPTNVLALNNLAYYLALQEGNSQEALAHITAAINLVGLDGELLDTRAVVYLRMKNPEKAIEDLQAAIGQAPTPMRYVHLAIAQQMAQSPEASSSYRKAVAQNFQPTKLHLLEQRAFQDALQQLVPRE